MFSNKAKTYCENSVKFSAGLALLAAPQPLKAKSGGAKRPVNLTKITSPDSLYTLLHRNFLP